MYKKLSNLAYCLYFFMKSDMKNFSKILGISLVCAVSFFGLMTQASTGDSIGTGNVDTGSIYTGALTPYLTIQENTINTLFTTTYAKLYGAFSKT